MRPKALAGLVILSAIVLIGLMAPWIVPIDPNQVTDVVTTRFLPPLTVDQFGVIHPLGTDRLGRDVWSRLAYGTRISLMVGTMAMVVSMAVGLLIGAAAALIRGPARHLLLGATDFSLALPRVVVLLLLAALWQPSTTLVIVTLGLTGWMTIARLTYAETLGQLGRPYLEGSTALGANRRRLFVRHVLPNISPSLLASATLGIGNAISLESGLSFLGLGVQPPATSWGNLIASGRDTVVNAPWVGLAPGIMLVLVVVACSLIASDFEIGSREPELR